MFRSAGRLEFASDAVVMEMGTAEAVDEKAESLNNFAMEAAVVVGEVWAARGSGG